MDNLNASLQNLHDIITPPPVDFWPPGQGAYLLLVAVVIVLVVLGYIYMQNYRINKYRRAGIELLKSAVTVYDVSVVLKRVALAAYSRERVASLYGKEWCSFLADTCPGCNFQGLQEDPDAEAAKELTHAAKVWVRKHNPAEKG